MNEHAARPDSRAGHRISMADRTETDLVALARDRNESAIRELVRRLNPRLFRVARGIMNNDADAEDVVQEAYLKAFAQIGEFRGEASFRTWVTRIAVNAARMRLRAARPEEEYDTVTEENNGRATVLPFPGSGADRPETELGRDQLRTWLETAVATLPERLRLVFLLRESEGMTVRAIAHDLKMNPITVKTRLFRARRQLRGALEARLNGSFDDIFPFAGARCAHMADRVVDDLRRAGSL